MTQFTIIAHQRVDNYAIVQTLTDTPIQPGQTINISQLGHNLNGSHTVLFCPQYAYLGVDGETGEWIYDPLVPRENQILFYDEGDDFNWSVDIDGRLDWSPTCTWIDDQDIEDYLALPLTSAGDAAFLVQCAAAANAFAYRRRWEAGYLEDSLTTSPGGDVTLGTIMIGAAYFRQRGSYNQIASFDGMGVAPPQGLSPMVMQLLGINRPQVA